MAEMQRRRGGDANIAASPSTLSPAGLGPPRTERRSQGNIVSPLHSSPRRVGSSSALRSSNTGKAIFSKTSSTGSMIPSSPRPHSHVPFNLSSSRTSSHSPTKTSSATLTHANLQPAAGAAEPSVLDAHAFAFRGAKQPKMVSENAGQMQAHRNEVEQRMRDEAGGGGGGGLAAGYLGNLESMAAVVDDAFQKLEELREYQFQIFQNHILLEGTKDEEEKAVLESMLDPTKGQEGMDTPFEAFSQYATDDAIDATITEMEFLCKKVQQFPTSELMVGAKSGVKTGGLVGVAPDSSGNGDHSGVHGFGKHIPVSVGQDRVF